MLQCIGDGSVHILIWQEGQSEVVDAWYFSTC